MSFVSPDVGCARLALSRKAHYEYQQLPHGDFVRYLILHPGKDDEPLSCGLKVSLLDKAPQFEAISYVWGTPLRDREIECDGKSLFITANLRGALRCVRWPTESRTLWADSICIDQADSREQGHQVALIGRIYRNANFPYLKPDDSLVLDSRWLSIWELLGRPWFDRGIDWLELLRVCVWIELRASLLSRTGIFNVPVELKAPFLATYLSGPHAKEARVFAYSSTSLKLDFLTFLGSANRDLKLTDERDRIYAFLGLAEELTGTSLVMAPDYKSHFLDVYLQFACQYLVSTGDLSLLNSVTHDEQTFGAPIPSFIPRWDRGQNYLNLCYSGWKKPLRSPTSLQTPLHILPSNVLQVRAVIIDSIHFESPIFPVSTDAADVARLWRNLPNTAGRYQQPDRLAHSLGCLPRLASFLGCLVQNRYRGLWDTWVAAVAAYIQTAGAQFNQGDLGDIEKQSAIGDATLIKFDVRLRMALN
ncbi:Heterokaryon incompatibility protein (HET) domain containing protein [Rhypophila decipiens]